MLVHQQSKNQIYLANQVEENVDSRNRDKEDPFKFLIKAPNVLRKMEARKVLITPIGQVLDPGFKE